MKIPGTKFTEAFTAAVSKKKKKKKKQKTKKYKTPLHLKRRKVAYEGEEQRGV